MMNIIMLLYRANMSIDMCTCRCTLLGVDEYGILLGIESYCIFISYCLESTHIACICMYTCIYKLQRQGSKVYLRWL